MRMKKTPVDQTGLQVKEMAPNRVKFRMFISALFANIVGSYAGSYVCSNASHLVVCMCLYTTIRTSHVQIVCSTRFLLIPCILFIVHIHLK